MAIREPDVIELRGGGGTLARFESIEISTSLVSPTEARFVMGDDFAWRDLERFTKPGAEYEVTINGTRLLKGRVEAREAPSDPGSGSRLELTIHTKLSDARYASADPNIKVSKVSLKDFIVQLFDQHGYVESDFVFATRTSVDLVTGAPKGSQKQNPNLAAMTIQQAMIQPPETVWEAFNRHTQRHAVMGWDMPDGRIFVGQPDDEVQPDFQIRFRRDAPAAVANNVEAFRRVNDWREVASEIRIVGQATGQDVTRKPVQALSADPEVFAVVADSGHFFRPVVLPNERAKSKGHAELIARRELSARRRRKDGFEAVADGWTYWNGQRAIPWCIGGVCDVTADTAGGPMGPYLIWRVVYRMSTSAGHEISNDGGQRVLLGGVRKGLWDLGEPA